MNDLRLPQVGTREVAYGCVGLLVIAILAFAIGRPLRVLPRITVSPAFVFTDQTGARVTSENLRGQLVLYSFAHQHCADPCAPIYATLKTLQVERAKLVSESIPLHLVTILFDPRDDAMGQVAAFAEQIGADPAVWSLLQGEAAQTRQVIGAGFGAYYAKQAANSYEFDPLFVLVDGAGIIRARYRTAAPALATLQRDLGLITTEARHSEGAMRLAYEAAHLFLCYPP